MIVVGLGQSVTVHTFAWSISTPAVESIYLKNVMVIFLKLHIQVVFQQVLECGTNMVNVGLCGVRVDQYVINVSNNRLSTSLNILLISDWKIPGAFISP